MNIKLMKSTHFIGQSNCDIHISLFQRSFHIRMAETMYAMKPVFELDADIEVPKCMYSLPVIQCSNHIPGVGSGVGTTTCPPGALQALEARQDAILARLEKLKAEVEAYKKTLGLPAQCDSSSTSSQVRLF